MEKPVKTLTINGTKYKVKGQVDSLSCNDLHLSADSNGVIDLKPLFNDNTVLNSKIEEYCPYKLDLFESGDELQLGQIKSMTLTADPDPSVSISVSLDFGNSAVSACDAMLWIDASDPIVSTDANIAIYASDPTITYDIVGHNAYQTVTHGKKCLFGFTRITQNTVLANKVEY